MDQQTEASSESTDTTTTTDSGASSTDTGSSSGDNATPAVATATGTDTAPAATEPPAYQPNYKFKANDEEHEIDEEYRAYIKSAEDEKRIKRLFEQFKGVERLKETYKTTRKEAGDYRQKVEMYDNSINAFNQLANAGKRLEALKLLGLDNKFIYEAAKQAMDFDELPQQAREIYNQAEEQKRFAQQMLQQNQAYQEQMAELKSNAKRAELEQTLAHPEVRDVVSKYEAINGAGSFRQDVIQEAQAEYLRTKETTGQGIDLTAQEAVNRVLRRIKPFMSVAQPQTNQQKEVPVIPATGSGSRGSPSSGPKIRSFKDLEKAYEKKMAERD